MTELGPIARATRNADPAIRNSMLHWLPWTTDPDDPCTVVADVADRPFIGISRTPVIAAEIVAAHNRDLKAVDVDPRTPGDPA